MEIACAFSSSSSNDNATTTINSCADVTDDFVTPTGFILSLDVDDEKPETELIVDCALYNWNWGTLTDVNCLSNTVVRWHPSFYKCYTISVPDNVRQVTASI